MTDFNEVFINGNGGGKRLDIVWTPWMGDWFTSWSPRNSNEHGEGPWAHWISLALKVLQHPLTERLWPELHAAVADFDNPDLYSETEPIGDLTDEEIGAALGREVSRG